jgi:predicted MFS family arabinose efflux permease
MSAAAKDPSKGPSRNPSNGPSLAAIVVAATTTIQTVASMSSNLMPAIAPIMAAKLGVPPALIGAQVSLVYSMATLVSLVSGSAIRRLGALFASQLALALIAVGLLLSCVPSLWCVAAGAVVMGAAYGLPTPAASHLLARFTPAARRNFIFSIKQTGVPLGVALAGLTGPWLAQTIGWNAPLVAVLIATGLLAVGLAPLRRRLDDDRVPGAPLFMLPHVGFKETLAHPALKRLFAAGILLAGVQVAITAFLVTVLVTEYGFAPVPAGLLLAGAQAIGVVGRLSSGAVADRLGGALTLAILATATAAITLALVFVAPAHRGLAVTLFLVLGFSANAWTGIYIAETVRLAPADRVSEATAVLLSGTFLGVVTGPLVFGAVGSLIGYRLTFAVLAAAALAAAVTSLAVRRSAATGQRLQSET